MRLTFGFNLVLSLFILLTTCSIFDTSVAEWLAIALVIVAGIPHGSFDLRVARRKWRGRPQSVIVITLLYVSCAVGMTSLCVFAPPIGLSIFLGLSAIHFSEGETRPPQHKNSVNSMLVGCSAILLPIGLHSDQAREYMSFFLSSTYFEYLAAPLLISSILVALLLASRLVLGMIRNNFKNDTTDIERIICLAGWIVLPPLSGFAIWFIGRHSRVHLNHCRSLFKGRLSIPVDFIGISVLAIAGLMPFASMFNLFDIRELFAASICLIAGLTLPHMIVTHGTYGNLLPDSEQECA